MNMLVYIDPTLAQIWTLGVGLLGGALVGLAHFGLLRWNTRLFAAGSAFAAAGLMIARLALVVVVFLALVQIVAGALIAGLIGLSLSRRIVLRRIGRTP